MPEIRLEHIIKKYRGRTVLDDVSLTILDGEYFALLGNTGGGKTTLLHIISGLVKPDAGKVLIDGVDITKKKPYERSLGLVFENYALFPHMTVEENISYSGRVRGKPQEETRETAQEIQRMLRLYDRENAMPSELSGGMQQRVALGRALMNMEGAGILLLDEPFKALDAGLRMNLRVEIRNLAKSENLHLTTIHITNDMTEAMMVSDRIALISDGQVIQVGTPQDIYYHPRTLYAAYFMSDTVYISGQITKRNGETYSVSVGNAEYRIESADQVFSQGDAVVVVVRNDYFKMYEGKTSPPDKENVLPGRVVSLKFMGAFIRFMVLLHTGQQIGIDLPSTYKIQEKFPAGVEVCLAFSPRKAFLFRDPGGEKLKELYFAL